MIIYVCLYVCHALPFSIFSVRVDLRNACTVNNYIYTSIEEFCVRHCFFLYRQRSCVFLKASGHSLSPSVFPSSKMTSLTWIYGVLHDLETAKSFEIHPFLVFKIPIWIGEIITWGPRLAGFTP